ncbi:MAG: hypothetical protein KF869_03595 [Phycisphaeraceae bacterium]|nr:hypothetical protein [Phycisphaeraceae bacterium]
MIAVCALALAGCAWTDAAGMRRHHLVLGLGIVTTSADGGAGGAAGTSSEGASIERISAMGAFIGAGPVINGLMIGWARMQSVRIDPDANVLVEAVMYQDGRFHTKIESVVERATEADLSAQNKEERP